MNESYLIDNEMCPSCDEKWIDGQGLDCANNCEHKQLEDKHRAVAQPMVDYCLLPKYQAWVDCPDDLTEGYTKSKGWGWTNMVGKKITIPWLTLRSKESFFNTTAHETGHILAYEERFIDSDKRIFEEMKVMIDEYNSLPTLVKYSSVGKNYQTQANNYYLKHKKIIDKYIDPRTRKKGEEPKWGHGLRNFYPALCQVF